MNPRSLLPLIPCLFLLGPVAARAQEAAAPAPAASALDFGNYTSETITGKAWAAYNTKDYATAEAYARKCIEMFRDQAVAMQKELTAPPTGGLEEVSKKWALNDVGTCYFILGQSLEAEKKTKEALEAYKFLVENLAFAQCWDTKGWFWKPADAAREKLKALEFDAMG